MLRIGLAFRCEEGLQWKGGAEVPLLTTGDILGVYRACSRCGVGGPCCSALQNPMCTDQRTHMQEFFKQNTEHSDEECSRARARKVRRGRRALAFPGPHAKLPYPLYCVTLQSVNHTDDSIWGAAYLTPTIFILKLLFIPACMFNLFYFQIWKFIVHQNSIIWRIIRGEMILSF